MPGYGGPGAWNWNSLAEAFANQAVDPKFQDPAFWEALIGLGPEAYEAQGMKWEPDKFKGQFPPDVIDNIQDYAISQREALKRKKSMETPAQKPTVADWFKNKLVGTMTTAEGASRLWGHLNPNK